MPPLARDLVQKLVDAVATLQQEHRQQRQRVSPDEMLAQVKARDQVFADVTLSQLRRAITAANNAGDSMDVEPSTTAIASPDRFAGFPAAHAEFLRRSPWMDNAPPTVVEPQHPAWTDWWRRLQSNGFSPGNLMTTENEDLQGWTRGRLRRHSVL